MTKREFQAAEYATEAFSSELLRESIDPSTLKPKPSPTDTFNLALSALLIDIKQLGAAAETLSRDRSQLDQISATLYVNFVSRATHGIRLGDQEFKDLERKSSHTLVVEILLRYHKAYEQLKTELSLATRGRPEENG